MAHAPVQGGRPPGVRPGHGAGADGILGLAAEEVEDLITAPLEQDLLNGVAWLAHIHSESVPGLSNIDLTFEPGTDPLKARQVVQERMTQAFALPNVSLPPLMMQPVSSKADGSP